MQPLYHVRAAHPDDVNELLDIDIKSFDNAWTPEEWDAQVRNYKFATKVVTYFGSAVGFAVFDLETSKKTIEIVKIAVKPGHRRKGLSARLVAEAIKYADAREFGGNPLTVSIVVPESTIYDGDHCLRPWLAALSFAGTKPFIKRRFQNLGEFEDGVRFVMSARS